MLKTSLDLNNAWLNLGPVEGREDIQRLSKKHLRVWYGTPEWDTWAPLRGSTFVEAYTVGTRVFALGQRQDGTWKLCTREKANGGVRELTFDGLAKKSFKFWQPVVSDDNIEIWFGTDDGLARYDVDCSMHVTRLINHYELPQGALVKLVIGAIGEGIVVIGRYHTYRVSEDNTEVYPPPSFYDNKAVYKGFFQYDPPVEGVFGRRGLVVCNGYLHAMDGPGRLAAAPIVPMTGFWNSSCRLELSAKHKLFKAASRLEKSDNVRSENSWFWAKYSSVNETHWVKHLGWRGLISGDPLPFEDDLYPGRTAKVIHFRDMHTPWVVGSKKGCQGLYIWRLNYQSKGSHFKWSADAPVRLPFFTNEGPLEILRRSWEPDLFICHDREKGLVHFCRILVDPMGEIGMEVSTVNVPAGTAYIDEDEPWTLYVCQENHQVFRTSLSPMRVPIGSLQAKKSSKVFVPGRAIDSNGMVLGFYNGKPVVVKQHELLNETYFPHLDVKVFVTSNTVWSRRNGQLVRYEVDIDFDDGVMARLDGEQLEIVDKETKRRLQYWDLQLAPAEIPVQVWGHQYVMTGDSKYLIPVVGVEEHRAPIELPGVNEPICPIPSSGWPNSLLWFEKGNKQLIKGLFIENGSYESFEVKVADGQSIEGVRTGTRNGKPILRLAIERTDGTFVVVDYQYRRCTLPARPLLKALQEDSPVAKKKARHTSPHSPTGRVLGTRSPAGLITTPATLEESTQKMTPGTRFQENSNDGDNSKSPLRRNKRRSRNAKSIPFNPARHNTAVIEGH